MTSYLAVQYSMARQPMTDFPSLLIDMLIRRCGLEPSLMVEVGPGRGDFVQAWVQRGFQVIPVDFEHLLLQDVLEANGFTEVKVERIYQYPPFWRYPALTILATLWRWITPVEFSLWLSNRTGWGCFRWSSQLTLLATARRPR
jgi:hypothetical protein